MGSFEKWDGVWGIDQECSVRDCRKPRGEQGLKIGSSRASNI